MLLMKQCRNVVLFVLSWREKSELCYHRLHRDNERRREQLLGLFLFLFQSKQALTLLFFLLIKLLQRGAGLTGPCLAGRPRVNGLRLNRRHLWAALSHCFPSPRIFSGRPPLSWWPVQWEECHSEKPRVRHKEQSRRWGFHGTGLNSDSAKIPRIVLTSSDPPTLSVRLCVCALKVGRYFACRCFAGSTRFWNESIQKNNNFQTNSAEKVATKKREKFVYPSKSFSSGVLVCKIPINKLRNSDWGFNYFLQIVFSKFSCSSCSNHLFLL